MNASSRIPLTAGWTVSAVGGSGFASVPANVAGRPVPAAVPGCVHTDLLAARVIPDPYLDDNESLLAWIGRVDWRYETSFDRSTVDNRVELVCAGLDTVARIELNGAELAVTRNMHRGYRFDVTDRLRPGRNALAITFTSALDHAEAMRDELGARPHVNRHPFNMIRKMACNFGWDWGPELVTAGIWRPIELHEWHTARLDGVRPLVTLTGTVGRVDTFVGIRRATDEPLVVTVRVGNYEARGTVPAAATEAMVPVEVPTPDLWWPRGHGAQPLYPITVELSTSDGRRLDGWAGRIGFRTVELDTGRDEHGTRFQFLVNGVPVLVRGANWIPDDCFPHRVDSDRYRTRLGQAMDAGVNLLRVWGGGIYESADFYDLADELGIMVWQDFLFACAAYPEEEPLRGEVIAEAREAVARLARHPSLVLWNGCNENIWGYHDWGWRAELGERTWGIGYYTDVLPKIVAELDPTRPYSPGSPWSFAADIHPNDPAHGATHVWNVWNDDDYAAYRATVPRFVAEFGWCGPPAMPTLLRAVRDKPLTAESPGMLAHIKADDGSAKLARGLAAHVPPQPVFADWAWAAQLVQARAVALGVQHFRSHAPRCAGTVLWQLNDCWPVTSWAVVDGDGRRKPAWYALRDSYQERLLTIQPRDDGLALVAVNDTGTMWWQHYEVLRVDFDGTVLATSRGTVQADPRGAVTVALPAEVSTPARPASELLIVLTGRDTIAPPPVWFFADDLDQRLPAPELTTHVTTIDGGYQVFVWAGTLLRDLTLLADQVAEDAVVDRALVTVLPGTSTTFVVRTRARIDPGRLAAPTVLRCANQLAVDH